MKELIRANDWVRLSWIQHLLGEAGIPAVILDHHTSILEGSSLAIPRRLMVEDRDHFRALALLRSAEEELEAESGE